MTTALHFTVPEGITCEDVDCPDDEQCALKGNGRQYGCVNPASDPCSPNPCQNGGTCNSKSGDFTCSCASGYIGDDCGITSSSKLQAATSEKESPQKSVEYSSQLPQQHSIVTTPVNQQQSMELSTQNQRATQQTSESQQPVTLSSLETFVPGSSAVFNNDNTSILAPKSAVSAKHSITVFANIQNDAYTTAKVSRYVFTYPSAASTIWFILTHPITAGNSISFCLSTSRIAGISGRVSGNNAARIITPNQGCTISIQTDNRTATSDSAIITNDI